MGATQCCQNCAAQSVDFDHGGAAGSGTYYGLNNILLLTDSYKVSHHLQYPPNTSVVYSYFESRGGLFPEVCFFGLQYFLKKYLVGPVVTTAKIAEAERLISLHLADPKFGYDVSIFNKAGWTHILKAHRGHLPVRIKALPEGTVVPSKNVLFTVENTDPKCYWLTTYLESLLVQVWYPTTVSTQSREQKKIIQKYLKETGSEDVLAKGLDLFKLHDFGFRGVSSVESAALGGGAHLVHFLGTDTCAALVMLRTYYDSSCAGYSIPASEHSTMTSWTREREVDAMRNMLVQYPKGLVACVSDSYDIYNACENLWGTELKANITSRDGVLVVRPDSGELPDTLLRVLSALESKFGSEQTSTGHKLLPPCIRVIQGDGIDLGSLQMILKAMQKEGWAADNVAFGSGGALLQKMHRDTLQCAMKCSYTVVAGHGVDVCKDPITDPGKRSKAGKMTLEKRDGHWHTVTGGEGEDQLDCLMEVFCDGKLLIDDNLEVIRKRANGEAVPAAKINPILRAPVEIDLRDNILMCSDSYKVTHHLQYPPGTQYVYSYFESRGGTYPNVCFFGLQYFLKRYMTGKRVTMDRIDRAQELFSMHFSHPTWGSDPRLFNRAGWQHIMEKHGGALPVVIKAVPEGTVVPVKNVLFTMENTDPECYWLTNYLETLLVQVWYPTTVCTQSRAQKKIIQNYLKLTGCDDVIAEGLHKFKLHDFGFRGVSSVESAALGGAAHLVNFLSTDTMVAISMVQDFYGLACAGTSFPASEHSTVTTWTKTNEVEAMKNMLAQFPKGSVSCVSDSYDLHHAVHRLWGEELKSSVCAREGIVFVRPDSGEQPKTVLQVLEKLENNFGSQTTSTGHKKLPAFIRVVLTDGIDSAAMEKILRQMKQQNWAADNLSFGSGGALLQKLHRDTQKCAFKCSHAVVDGGEVDVVKDPVTDPGKKSKAGVLTLECDKGVWKTVTGGKGDAAKDQLAEVFRDGELIVDQDFETIRARAEKAPW